MAFINLIAQYLLWHYSAGITLFFRLWGTAFWFMNRFFSVPLLLSTMFSPWRRMSEGSRGGGIEGFFSALIVNTMMRLVGFLFRLCLLFAFALSILIVLVSGVAAFAFWISFPIVIPVAFVSGVMVVLS